MKKRKVGAARSNGKAGKDLVVIGASAGGIEAVTQLVSKIPADLPIALFVVIHISKRSIPAVIVNQLQKNTKYQCLIAKDGDEIKAGYLYLAPPDVHLLIKKGCMRLINGPHENYWRPSIDVLFRSAAASYDSHVIGIILSGMLDDGTSGMSAVSRSGGISIVQEPSEAAFMDMPVSVLNNVDVDYRVSIRDMGYVIDDILSKPAQKDKPIPEDVKIEADITERMVSHIETLDKIGERSNFSCPDCGGGLWKIKTEAAGRYRCFTGHVYTEKLLLEKQGEGIEESLWVSIRMMEERRNLLLNMAWHSKDNSIAYDDYCRRADLMNIHIDRLKELLSSAGKPDHSNMEQREA